MALMRCTTIRIGGIVAAAIISSPRIIHAQATSATVPGYIAADNSSTGAVPAVAGRVAAMTPKNDTRNSSASIPIGTTIKMQNWRTYRGFMPDGMVAFFEGGSCSRSQYSFARCSLLIPRQHRLLSHG